MARIEENERPPEAKAAWSVVVAHQDAAARQRAVAFCDQLVARFWERFEFEVSWFPFDLLAEATAGKEAAGKAAQADLVVISAAPEGDFPAPLKGWIETWLGQRGDREGVLVGLMEPLAESGSEEGRKHNYLRSVAHRAALDYLTGVPQEIARTIPDSLDSYTQRAAQVTNLLDGILHQQAPPPGPAL
jgi:hypothetical protein